MTGYILRRTIAIVPLIWAIATITFLLMHAVPGGPFDREKELPQAVQDNLARKYEIDGSLWDQYSTFITNLVQLDLGLSFAQNRPVTEVMADGVPTSIQLGVSAFIFATLLGISLGVLSAVYQNGIVDYVGVFIATIGAAVPSFVIAILLVVVFSLKLGWFDVLGWELWNYKKMVLPTVALGLLPGAFIARVTRAAMLEVLRQDYIRTARAKGVIEYRVVAGHAVRNALIPVLTVAGPIFAGLITGSFIIERIFEIPGIGRQFVNAVFVRDYGMIMGTTLLFAVAIAVMNLLVDVAYAFVDPRIRY